MVQIEDGFRSRMTMKRDTKSELSVSCSVRATLERELRYVYMLMILDSESCRETETCESEVFHIHDL
jgi:hypothetical protein